MTWCFDTNYGGVGNFSYTPSTKGNKMFFTFHQNNSGGSFIGPSYVIVEAKNAEEANTIALEHDVYFDGCRKGIDCGCCGDRWYPVSDHDGTDQPEIYGEPLETFKLDDWYLNRCEAPQLILKSAS